MVLFPPRQTPVRRLSHVRRLWFNSLPTSQTNRALRCQILHTKSTTPMNSTSDACQTPVPHQTPVVQFPPDHPDKPCITVSNTAHTKHNSHELHVRWLWFNSLQTSRTNRALRCQILQQQQQQKLPRTSRQTPVVQFPPDQPDK